MISEFTSDDILFLATILMFAFMINFFLSWLIFAHLSMRPLEKKLKAANKDSISQWDGPGWRVVTYAIKLVLPASFWGKNTMLIDPYVLKELATTKDKTLAFWLILSGLLFVIVCIWYAETFS
ncbi:hypothetical protein MN202_13520 [Rheinheimera muenzenbergensis]|uniref:SdpI/YhfL protein family protein n=1 Tax=Rheinheimera muenzenbergensis TaxID=1193628 RepID=A0ABU8C8I2_9GAMM